MPITLSDTCDPESTSQLFTNSSSRLTVNIETALYQDMEKATTEISEDTEKSFTKENPPYFDEDIQELLKMLVSQMILLMHKVVFLILTKH